MDLAEIFRVMRRRWYVLLPGLLLTAVLTAGAAFSVPVTYQSQSTVMLLNSKKATVAFGGNPFLSSQTSLTGMADSLARNLNSDASLAALRKQGVTGTPVAKIADNALGPMMWLTVTGTDRAAVLTSDRLLTAYAKQRLAEFQDQQSVATAARIRMMTVVAPQNPVAQTKTRLEYLVLAALLGLVASMVATFWVEARRRTAGAGKHTGGRSARGDGSAGGEPAPVRAARPAPRWSTPGGNAPDGNAPGGEAPSGGPDEPPAPYPHSAPHPYQHSVPDETGTAAQETPTPRFV